jgi:hypothetical protein
VEIALRFVFDDGTRQEGGPGFRVSVLDRDDTPPDHLSFASGGTVAAGEIGAAVGILSVSDPDSADPFHFSFAPDDEWRFEVVDGGVLKLRDGISLGWDDVPARPVLVEVSDGTQSAAFALNVAVTEPADAAGPAPATPPLLAAGETRAGFELAGPREALTTRSAEEAAAVSAQTGGALRVTLDEGGGEVWLGPAVDRVRFADGWLAPAGEGPAAQAAALHRAVFGEDADGLALALLVAELRGGAGWAEVAADLLDAAPALSALDDTGFVSALHRAALGAEPGDTALSSHAARLSAGAASRAQVVADIALSPAALARVADAAPDVGHWVSDPFDPDAGLPARPAFDGTHPATGTTTGSAVEIGWFM